VLRGEDLKAPGGLARLPVPVSTPGFDSALTATLCITRDPDSDIQNMGTYRAALKASDGWWCAWGARGERCRRLSAWLKYRERREPMPIAIVIGCAPVVMFTRPQKLAIDLDEPGRRRARRRADRDGQSRHRRSRRARVVGDRHRGLIDPQMLEPGAVRGE
jgi:4-hydroxy-3-polyprenylbenzoate decarboxylase